MAGVVVALAAAAAIVQLTLKVSTMVEPVPVVKLKGDGKNCQEVPELLRGVKTIVCVGDSTTRGARSRSYPDILERYLQAVFPQNAMVCINAGVNGDTSDDVVARYDRDVLGHKPDLVILMIGINDVGKGFDADHPQGGGPRGVPLDRFVSNVQSIIDKAAAGKYRLMLVSPGAVEGILTSDGFHPNDAGLKIFVNCILLYMGVSSESRQKVQDYGLAD
jgi:lysophospholipase L1-like esterase